MAFAWPAYYFWFLWDGVFNVFFLFLCFALGAFYLAERGKTKPALKWMDCAFFWNANWSSNFWFVVDFIKLRVFLSISDPQKYNGTLCFHSGSVSSISRGLRPHSTALSWVHIGASIFCNSLFHFKPRPTDGSASHAHSAGRCADVYCRLCSVRRTVFTTSKHIFLSVKRWEFFWEWCWDGYDYKFTKNFSYFR